MKINKFGIAHDFLGRQHGLNSITCVRLQLAQSQQRVKELEAALTPSGETKGAYSGEFPGPGNHEFVPWTTIKDIMKAIREYAAVLEDQG